MPKKQAPPLVADLEARIRQILCRPIRSRLRIRDILDELKAGPGARRTVKRLIAEITQGRFAEPGEGGPEPEAGAAGGDQESIEDSSKPARARQRSTGGGLVGRLRLSGRGHGTVLLEESPGLSDDPEARERTIFIPKRNLGEAFHGDRVRVSIIRRATTPQEMSEGVISAILERATTRLVGTYYRDRRGGNVVPRDERLTRTISVPLPDPNLRVAEGAYVVAEILEWPPYPHPLIGRVVECLGDENTRNIDVTLIIKGAGVADTFPEEALEEAQAIARRGLTEEDVAGRFDFRGWTTFTIDGITAKDFDDALSISRLEDGLWRLGVHIADVSYYVREGSPLDQEAASRATSIYPVDRVVPMLPEALSNDLCSLRPEVDRLTLSCIMDVDDRGKVHEYSIHEGVIRSSFRLTYDDVQAVMDGKADPATARRLGPVWLQLEDLYRLRRILTAMRMERGALDLDIPETEIVFEGAELDYAALPEPSRHLAPRGDRAVKAVVRRPRLDSHRVVEECMLLANEVVAAHLFNLQVPSIYRIHEQPDLEKLKSLTSPLAHLGVRLAGGKGLGVKAIQAALEQAADKEHGAIARRLILRAMMRARYADFNAGHFGLASACYTHFTSPIRRYPDLLVHRILRETLQAGARNHGKYRPPMHDPGAPAPRAPEPPGGGDEPLANPHGKSLPAHHLSAQRLKHYSKILGALASHCSERERRSEQIERDCKTLKALEFMRGFHGEPFEGVVTSVVTFGFFVELDRIPVEGLVPLRGLDNDFYEFDEERLVLTGKRSGDTIKLGDRVVVCVENVDLASLTLDFALLDRIRPEGYDAERQRAEHEERRAKEQRHIERRPAQRGFQQRGAKMRGRNRGGRR